MARKALTDRTLKALQPAPKGKRYDLADAVVPGLGVRVTDKGQKTFVFVARYPGSKNPTRRALGEYGALTLEQARSKARGWIEMIQRGVDPAQHEERERLAEERRRQNTFGAVAEDFISEKLPAERSGKFVEREIRQNFMPKWAARPITEITDDEIVALIKAKARKAPSQARNLLATIKRLLQWGIDQRAYGLKTSPAAGLKPAALCGEIIPRERVLTDDELFALWRAVSRMRYPHGPAYQLLLLTGLRLNEVAEAPWTEFDPAVLRLLRHRTSGERNQWQRLNATDRVWVIAAKRMKAKNSRARPHSVPLIDEILTVLDGLPQFDKGAFLFSTTFGEKPAWLGDKIKKTLDARMLRTLRALAKLRGDDENTIELVPWRNHDIRRTVRTHLSRLKISEEAREAVLAHVRPGIKGVYDRHEYFDEKREALKLWAARLASIVEPKGLLTRQPS